jgi:hypothetical protein
MGKLNEISLGFFFKTCCCCFYPLGAVVVLIALHHHLKFFVNFVVLGLGPGRQRVIGGVDILAGTVGTAATILVLFLVQRLVPTKSAGQYPTTNATASHTKKEK